MSQMYPAFSQSKKSKSNYELLEQLKQNSLNWYEVEHQGYKLPSTSDPHEWCGKWIWKGCLNVAGHAGVKKGFHSLTWFGDLSYSKLIMPKYENELNLCPYCSEKMVRIEERVWSGKPPPQMMECVIDVLDWFIPEYPQFLR